MLGPRTTARLGLALLAAAALFDAAPLYVPAIALLVLPALSVAWVRTGARGLRVERRIAARRVVEGEPLGVELVLGARVALPACTVEDPLLERPMGVRGGGHRTATLRVAARFARRGRRTLAPPSVVVRDPFGLAERSVRGASVDEILVLPRVEPVLDPGDARGEAGELARRVRPGIAQAAEVDVDGLRPYREGAPASRIHWAALARTGELVERRLRPEGDTRPLVVLDARAAAGEEGIEQLDAAVRAAASLCVHLARAGGCGLLLPGDRRPAPLEPGLAGWPHLHARLAVVPAGGAPSVAALAVRRGPILYVAARPLARPPRALLHAPGAGRFLVVPAILSGWRPAFDVAGCHGYDLAPARAGRSAA